MFATIVTLTVHVVFHLESFNVQLHVLEKGLQENARSTLCSSSFQHIIVIVIFV